MPDPTTAPLLAARARVLHDLAAHRMDTARTVSLLDEAVAARQWWLQEWPAGAELVACLVAQDVQEALSDVGIRWPLCIGCAAAEDAGQHELRVSPDLGPDPHWVCEEAGEVAAPVGALPAPSP